MSVCAAIANASRWLMEACSTLLDAVCSPDFVWCGGAAWMTLFFKVQREKFHRNLPCGQHVVDIEGGCIACMILEHG